jgi:XTP/dITP diphosphohydrolase
MEPSDDVFLFATGNSDKRKEFESLLGEFIHAGWNVYDANTYPEPLPEVDEDRDTFVGNAIKKAVELSHHTSAAALSDDSGLVVDALGGEPGVHSARWSGRNATDEKNNEKLVAEIESVPEGERDAHYECIACLALPDNRVGRAILLRAGVPFEEVEPGDPTAEEGLLVRHKGRVVIWFQGRVDGKIITQSRGEHGFGYDPYFYVEEWDKTMAEVPLDKKNEISHRARALRKMSQYFHGNP